MFWNAKVKKSEAKGRGQRAEGGLKIARVLLY
jgi:hypothetical protein